ncbi:hypothetical protein [Marinobacter salarius]|jgi:signal-transduction protein with cAMP-binding, CBS, and nucleotidyltransferase domain|uniref:hypothetical protein n=1 Tax=Marinobacter salarius TaxID=1420917 RepID=UPI0018F1732F|nr:hypothetical protein [Marinobacter salarius]MBJ7275614.1 hypothetical protein [Marinobacter salarius]
MGNQSSVQASLSAGARYRLVSPEDEGTLTNDAAASELLKDFTRQAPVIVRSSREIQEVKKTLDVSGETFCVVINRNDEEGGVLTLNGLRSDELIAIFKGLHSDYLLGMISI